MGISRRGFLKSILAAAVSPAIVRAESLMPISVPKQDLILPGSSEYLEANNAIFEGFSTGDFTIETWIRPIDNKKWHHIAQVQRQGRLESYVDGVRILNKEFESYGFKVTREGDQFILGFDKAPPVGQVDNFSGHLGDLRVNQGTARAPGELGNKSLLSVGESVERDVAKFERTAQRGIHQLESFVDRADTVARQETPSGILAALFGRV